MFAKHLLQHYQISPCLEVERKVQRLVSQIWKHEVVALKSVPLKCNCSSMGSVVESHFTREVRGVVQLREWELWRS